MISLVCFMARQESRPMRSPLMLFTASLALLGCVAEASSPVVISDADVVVIAEDIYYEPDTIEIPAGQTVRLELRNDGGIVHDLVLENGWESGHVNPGSSLIVDLGPLTASTTAWCSIPGHRDAGMELRIEVVTG